MFPKNAKRFRFTDGILLLAILLVGGFHEYVSCILAAAMSVWLLIRLARQKKLSVQKDLLTCAMAAVSLGYGLTCLWGIDRGMALVGFLKFLPLLLYLLCLQQEDAPGRALEALPWFGVALAAISAVGMQFPKAEIWFAVDGRLSGTFQYPNTFAVFLLVCELLVLKKQGKKIWDYFLMLLLIVGMLYTGSRTAFLVAILANAVMLLAITRKKTRLIALIAMAVCLVGLLVGLRTVPILQRYLRFSLTENSVVTRLLYWTDALKLLVKYPFGMGFMGYFYAQQQVQTGLYSVMYLHNDFLQLFLDVGLIPTGLFVAALGKWFFKKSIPLTDKIIVGAVCLHSFCDFDLQYIGIFMLLVLLLSGEKTDKRIVLKAQLPLKLSFGAVTLASLYLGVSLMASHLINPRIADKLYPYDTRNKLSILEQETRVTEANEIADSILKQNTHFYAPYNIKAKYYYTKGQFGPMIENAKKALERNPFNHTAYQTYCEMLFTVIDLYQKIGDTQSVEICKQEILAMYRQFLANKDRLSKLGSMIREQPVLELPAELVTAIQALEP